MASFRCVFLPLAVVVLVTVVNGDITGTNPEAGSCLCPATGSLNIRDAPCGNVIGIASINQCFKSVGRKEICTLDIDYEYFEIDYNGRSAWAVGNYLNLEAKGYCTEFPCGAPQPGLVDAVGRIIGGTDSTRNAWPWQLALETGSASDWELACGAVLLSADYALTSASCLEPVQYPIRLLAGVYALSDPVDSKQIRHVSQDHITVHPDFSNNTYLNNLAIIHLTEPYDLSTASIRNICLPPSADSSFIENPGCYLTGWGITQDGGSNADILQRTGIDVIRPNNCIGLFPTPVYPTETCTLDQASHSVTPCDDDMGGPLSCLINTRFQLAGIGSFTVDNCDPRTPQIYTNIPMFVDWIREITGIE